MKEGLKHLLVKRLGGVRRLAIVGAGSCLKADDAAGIVLTDRLMKKCASPCLLICSAGAAPENYTGVLRQFAPEHVLLIDAADFGGNPGDTVLIPPEAITGVSFSTHMLPLNFFLTYLCRETGCAATVIGIQPLCLAFGAPMSKPVQTAVSRVSRALVSALSELRLLS